MPTGHYTCRRVKTRFHKEPKHTLVEALEWMEWLKETQGPQLQHKVNGGEKQVGRRGLPVVG